MYNRAQDILLLLIGLMFILTLSNCSSNEISEGVNDFINDNIQYFSHVLSFGSEISNTPDEFLLVTTSNFSLTDNACIIGDEFSLKIFNTDGKAIKRMGRRGQGPYEFQRMFSIFSSPYNYITTVQYPNIYLIISPEYEFITQERLRLPNSINNFILKETGCKNINLIKIELKKVLPLNNNFMVFVLELTDQDLFNDFVLCYFKNDDDYQPIVLFKKPDILRWTQNNIDDLSKGGATIGPDIGRYQIDLLLGEKVLYYTSHEDSIVSINEAYYTINIYSLADSALQKYKYKYDPIPYPSVKTIDNYYREGYGNSYKQWENMVKVELEHYKNKKYLPAIINITIDGNYLFVFFKKQWQTRPEFNIKNKKYFDVDIIDLGSMKLIHIIKLPEIYQNIKGGFMYDGDSDENGFRIISKYKINPIVYGLPEDSDWRVKK